MLNSNSKSFELSLRIDWSELDLFGHVNNTNYFKYTQSNRLIILDYLGLNELHRNTGVGPTLGNTQCRFIKSLMYPGNVRVNSTIKSIGNSSFVIEHDLYNDDNTLCAQAEDVIVVFDYNKECKVLIPNDVRIKLEELCKG